MKVLHVLYSGLGGHSNVFFSMVQADLEKEFEYQALFNGVEPMRPDNIIQCESLGIKWQYEKKEPGKHIPFLWQLTKKIKESKPDIIFIHGSVNIPAAFFAKLITNKKQKIIVRETQANHLKTKMEWAALKIALQLANKIVFLSNEYKEEVKKKINFWFRPRKAIVIPNGINLDVFRPQPLKSPGTVTLGMQSRLVAIKDHITLFEAVKVLKEKYGLSNFILKIAGDGDNKKALQKAVNDLSLQNEITFLGMLKESELPAFLHSCDIYIHASFGETMSTAIMQAMACRLPIIASDVKGINNMITNGENGSLVPVLDKNKMAETILDLINNPGKAAIMAEAAYNFSRLNFDNKLMFERYKAIF